MVVNTGPGVFLGAHTVVSRGKADLRFPIFVFAFDFIVVLLSGQTREMVFQSFLSVLCVVFATHEVVDESPETTVGSSSVCLRAIVTEEVLHVELVVLQQMHIELKLEQIHQVVIAGATRHAGECLIPFKNELLHVSVG